jgi:hypothetical protein
MTGERHSHGGWVVLAAWLAVFCLFGYRATFAILKGPMAITPGLECEWTLRAGFRKP